MISPGVDRHLLLIMSNRKLAQTICEGFMAIYMVERDLPDIKMEDLAEAQKRAIQAGKELTAQGKQVKYIRSTFVPGESKCMCLFEAADSEYVKEANQRARVPFTRIVPALDLTPK
jgi:muconolactone delta-isomerase